MLLSLDVNEAVGSRCFRRSKGLPWILSLFLLLGGCATGPRAQLFLLEPWSAPAASSETNRINIRALGLATISLPGYAQDEKIANRGPEGSVILDDRHRWAEEPEAAMTRTLSSSLRHHSGATVISEPWPRGFEPEARVEVVFDRLLREPDGGVDMEGQVHLIAGDGRRVLSVRPFDIRIGGLSETPAAFFAAISRGLDAIARQSVAALQGPDS